MAADSPGRWWSCPASTARAACRCGMTTLSRRRRFRDGNRGAATEYYRGARSLRLLRWHPRGWRSRRYAARCVMRRRNRSRAAWRSPTCLRRGEIEISTRFEPSAASDYAALLAFIEKQHGNRIFSRDGSTIDQQVATLLLEGQTIALAESCTGGLAGSAPGSERRRLVGVCASAVPWSTATSAKSEMVEASIPR